MSRTSSIPSYRFVLDTLLIIFVLTPLRFRSLLLPTFLLRTAMRTPIITALICAWIAQNSETAKIKVVYS